LILQAARTLLIVEISFLLPCKLDTTKLSRMAIDLMYLNILRPIIGDYFRREYRDWRRGEQTKFGRLVNHMPLIGPAKQGYEAYQFEDDEMEMRVKLVESGFSFIVDCFTLGVGSLFTKPAMMVILTSKVAGEKILTMTMGQMMARAMVKPMSGQLRRNILDFITSGLYSAKRPQDLERTIVYVILNDMWMGAFEGAALGAVLYGLGVRDFNSLLNFIKVHLAHPIADHVWQRTRNFVRHQNPEERLAQFVDEVRAALKQLRPIPMPKL